MDEKRKNKKIILFTIHCTKCNVLEKKLMHAGIDFDINEDIEEMKRRNYTSAPILEVDGVSYNFGDAIKWLKEIGA